MGRIDPNSLLRVAPQPSYTPQPVEPDPVMLSYENMNMMTRAARKFEQGQLEREYGKLGFEFRRTNDPLVQQRMKLLQERIDGLGDDGAGFTDFLGNASSVLGQMTASAVDPRMAVDVAAGATTFGAIGALGGPAGSGFGAGVGATAGAALHMAQDAFEVEAGSSYVELLEAGVDPATAYWLSGGVGVVNMALEMGSMSVVAAPFVKPIKEMVQVGVKKAFADTSMKAIAARTAGAYAGAVAAETSTEVLQEAFSITAEEIGKVLTDPNLPQATPDEIIARLTEIGTKTLSAMTVLAAPGGGAVLLDSARARRARRNVENMDKFREIIETLDEETATEQTIDALVRAEQKGVWISAEDLSRIANESGDPAGFYASFGATDGAFITQVEDAAVLGGDVRLNASLFGQLMNSDVYPQLRDHVRFDEEGMTAAEEKEFEKDKQRLLMEAATFVEDEPETIQQAGVRIGDKVYTGQTHPDALEAAAKDLKEDPDVVAGRLEPEAIDIFVTSRGRIVSRQEAFDIAVAQNQIELAFPREKLDPDTELGSEDLEPQEEVDDRFVAAKLKVREEKPGVFKVRPTLAEAEMGLRALFQTAKEAGMTDKEYERYLVTLQKAADRRNTAEERRRLKSELSSLKGEAKEIREQLLATARESVGNIPVYQALNGIGRERLNREAVVEILPGGKEQLKQLPKVQGRAIYEKGGTIDPEVYADLYGFDGADIMLFAMIDAKPFEQAVAEEAERLFNERYSGVTTKQKELEEQIEALHNDSQAAVLSQELNALRVATAQKRVKPALVRAAAKDRLRDLPLKEIRPNKFLAAERRAAKKAAKLLRAGDRTGAAQAKLQQLINFYMAQESYKVRERVKSQHKYFKKFLRGQRHAAFSEQATSNQKFTVDLDERLDKLFRGSGPVSTTIRDHSDPTKTFTLDFGLSANRLFDNMSALDLFATELDIMLAQRLKASVGDVTVYLVSPETMTKGHSGGERPPIGLYVPEHHVIMLSENLGNYTDETIFRVIMHELVHAATVNAMFMDVTSRTILEEVRSAITTQRPDLAEHYGLTDVYELLSEGLTTIEFQQALKSTIITKETAAKLKAKGWANKSFWEYFIDVLRQILGLEKDSTTALEAVVQVFDLLSSDTQVMGQVLMPPQERYAARGRLRNLPVEYLNIIRTMLGVVNLKRPKTLRDMVAELQSQEGIILSIPLKVVEMDGRKHYLDMTLREWEDLYEAVKTVEEKGLAEMQFLRAAEKANRDLAADEVIAQIETNLNDRSEKIVETNWEKFGDFARGLRMLLFNTDSILSRIDGFVPLGRAYHYLKRPYDEAISRGYMPGQIGFTARMKKESQKINTLFSAFTKKELLRMKRKLQVPGVRAKMSHQRVLAVLLNSGNLENRLALTESGQFTDAEIDAIHEYATKKDWDFVQGVWDYLESFWPEVRETTIRRQNFDPVRVEATPIDTKHGTYRGGYYPLQYDGREAILQELARTDDVQKLIEALRFGSFTMSHTRNGHTRERQGSAGRAVKLDLFVINAHVDQVVYDLEVGDAVIDIYKVLHHRRVRKAFQDQGQVQVFEQLDLWFGDIVMGEMHSGTVIERLVRWLRTGFVVSKIGYNFATIAMQPLGLLQSMPLLGKWNVIQSMMETIAHPLESFRFVDQSSTFMQQREATYNREIIEAQSQLKSSIVRRVTPGNSAEAIATFAFYGLIKMQRFVDIVTWIAGKRKGMKLFGDEAKAIEYADRMVARTQGSGIFGERTQLERGTIDRKHRQSEITRAFVPLISYFMAKTNVAYQRIRRTDPRNPLQIIDLAVDLTLMYLVEALVVAAIRGDWPEDEDDVPLMVFQELIKSIASGIPGFRDLVGEAEGFRGGGILAMVLGEAQKFMEQVNQRDIDAALIKSGARVGGSVAAVPGTSQMIRTGEAFNRQQQGEDVNVMEYLFGPQWRD